MKLSRVWAALVAAVVAASMLIISPEAAAAGQNDAGSRKDAGNTFDSAMKLSPRGLHGGRLDLPKGDMHDYYRFGVKKDSSISIRVYFEDGALEPVTLLDPSGRIVDVGTKVGSSGVTLGSVFAGDYVDINRGPRAAPHVRLAVHRALVAGDYRLHLQAERSPIQGYEFCFMNCETPRTAPIELIFGGSLRTTHTKVLLVPPTHGDLGNPLGPDVIDYIDATVRGVRRWEKAFTKFAKDYPQYSYLRKIDVQIEIFDGVDPVDPALYDVIIGYVAAGPVFRGVATDEDPGYMEDFLYEVGLGSDVRFTGRGIALSLFGSSPRAGQITYDFPEIVDLEMVTMHEFGHTFGLGHTLWHSKIHGPDVMNSPATFIYGDGFAAGDGGERTKMDCLSSLDLYGMAQLYRWVPSGKWKPVYAPRGGVKLPAGMPYEWYC